MVRKVVAVSGSRDSSMWGRQSGHTLCTDATSTNEEDLLPRGQTVEAGTAHQRGGHPWEEKRAVGSYQGEYF